MQVLLKELRLERGISIKDVADYCGVDERLINAYEVDSTRLPMFLIIQFTKLYKISPSTLFI